MRRRTGSPPDHVVSRVPVSECVDVLFVADDTYMVGLADGSVVQVDKGVD